MNSSPNLIYIVYSVMILLLTSCHEKTKERCNMSNDPFFNRITLQLIEIPTSSHQVLEAAKHGQSPPIPHGAEFPIESAKSWVQDLFRNSFYPQDNTPFVAFDMENGNCDVVRAEYNIGEYEIEIAQTKYLINIKIKGVSVPSGMSDKQVVEEMARKIFVMEDRIHFEISGVFKGGSCGKQSTSSKELKDPEWPHWIDTIHWWRNSNEIGFITLKAAGGPTKATIGPDEEMNISWFRK